MNLSGPDPFLTDIAGDPLLVDPGAGNFHLAMGSTAVDFGDPAEEFLDRDGSRNDQGADGGPTGVQDLFAPVAMATVSPPDGPAPLTVTFDASGSADEWGIAAFEWDADARDGFQADAAGEVAVYEYTQEGRFTATLRVTDNSGMSSETPLTVEVGDGLPTASAALDIIAGPAPFAVQFTGVGSDPFGGAVAFSWDFGDGETSTEQSPAHVYAMGTLPGAYTSVLTVTNLSGNRASSQSSVPLTVTRLPVLAATTHIPGTPSLLAVNAPENALDGASVAVPADATSAPIVVTLSGIEDPLPSPFGRMSVPLAQVELGPAGFVFSNLVTVAIPHGSAFAPEQDFVASFHDEATGQWSSEGISNISAQGEDFIGFDTSHFSHFVAGAAWTILDLGTLGGSEAVALGGNEAGQVVGHSTVFVASGISHAFLWDSSTGITDLGVGGANESFAFDVNESSIVTGYIQFASLVTHAFLWDSTNGLHDLGALTGTSSFGQSINNNSVIAGFNLNAGSIRSAFIWDSSNGRTAVPPLVAGQPNIALGINNASPPRVVGGSDISSGVGRAFIWDSSSGLTNMGVLTGGNYSEARAVNDSDQAAGEATSSGGETHAFFWDSSSGMVDLGTLGGNSSRANGISPTGEVVGESTMASGGLRAFLWANRNTVKTLINLNEFLPAESGWTLRRAWSINASSEIAGEGKRNAFLLQPVVP